MWWKYLAAFSLKQFWRFCGSEQGNHIARGQRFLLCQLDTGQSWKLQFLLANRNSSFCNWPAKDFICTKSCQTSHKSDYVYTLPEWESTMSFFRSLMWALTIIFFQTKIVLRPLYQILKNFRCCKIWFWVLKVTGYNSYRK